MKIAVVGFAELEDFLLGLPFLKGLRDLYMEHEIIVEGPDHYKKMKDFCFYISDILPNIDQSEYDIVLDVKNKKVTSKVPCEIDFEDKGFHNFHQADQWLSYLPSYVCRRQILLKETVKGFEEVKKMNDEDFDIVLFPFQSKESSQWNDKDFMAFLSYFFQMNKGRRVCVVGFEKHREELERKFKNEIYPKDLLHVEICSLDKMISLVNRSAYVLSSDSSLKYLIRNDDTFFIEVAYQDAKLQQHCSYKENSFVVHFKKQMESKVVYTYDEMVFDSNAHLLSYIVTAILDEDEEKLRWFAENYISVVDLFRTKIDAELGLRLIPVYWAPVNIVRSLVDTSLRMKTAKINRPHFAEEFYFYVHDDSDFSQERILMDFDNIRRYLEHMIDFFRASNEFAKQMKIKNTSPGSFEEAIFALTDSAEDLTVVLFFIRQVMNVSSQKLLENLPMTASYYS